MTSRHIENPYLLLTPGPLSTTRSVKEVMLRDWCTWDDDYNQGVVQVIRRTLVGLATRAKGYTSVLMQGSGTFAVEALVGTAIARDDKLLVLANGAYGRRVARIAQVLAIDHAVIDSGERDPLDPDQVDKALPRIPPSPTSPWSTARPRPACSTRLPPWARWFDAGVASSSSMP